MKCIQPWLIHHKETLEFVSVDWYALNWGTFLSTVVPTFFVGVDSFDKTRFSFLQDILIIAGNRMRGWRGDVSPVHLIAKL